MFVLVFVTLFLMTRAGEYNDELMLDNQILHVGCFADESHEDANAMLCLRQVCRGLSHADKNNTRGTSDLPHDSKDKHMSTRSEHVTVRNENRSMYYIRPMPQHDARIRTKHNRMAPTEQVKRTNGLDISSAPLRLKGLT